MNDSQTQEITNRIIAAAKASNYQAVIELATVGKDYLVLEQRQKEIQDKLKAINGQTSPAAASPVAPHYRKCLIEATYGGIKYSYLLVSKPLRKRVLAKGETLKIYVPVTGETFTTDIYLKNKNLREREAIGRFYDAAKVKEGDLLFLTETAPGEWTLTKAEQAAACNATAAVAAQVA